MFNNKDLAKVPNGFTALYTVSDCGDITSFFAQKNTIMVDAPDCFARCLAGDRRYSVAYMYFEFENLTDPTDDPIVPSYTKAENVDYYTGLIADPTKDFLRVPVNIYPSFTDSTGNNEGNLVTFFAIAGGVPLGEHGRAFNEASNSVVYGGALVASPTGEASADKIIARNYPASAKVPKVAGEQIVMQWSIEFNTP